MLLVTVAGLGLAVSQLWVRIDDFRQKAATHSREAVRFAAFAKSVTVFSVPPGRSEQLNEGHELYHAAWKYHEELKAKYEMAARYPRIHVNPDPPHPGVPWFKSLGNNQYVMRDVSTGVQYRKPGQEFTLVRDAAALKVAQEQVEKNR